MKSDSPVLSRFRDLLRELWTALSLAVLSWGLRTTPTPPLEVAAADTLREREGVSV